MQNRFKKLLGTALIALAPTGALASSHREAPAISNDPAADNTDLYAWVTPTTHDKLIVLANYIPLEEPAGGPNFFSFSDDVLYQVHIDKGDKIDKDFATYQITFHTTRTAAADENVATSNPIGNGLNFFSQIAGIKQTYSVVRIDANGGKTTLISNASLAPPNIGPETDAVAYSNPALLNGGSANFTYDDAHIAAAFIHNTSDGGRVFVGPRDDGFYVDLGGIFDLAQLRPHGVSAGTCASGVNCAQDGVAGYNTETIALEIPLSTLGLTAPVSNPTADANILGVWASASRRKVTVLHNDGSRESSGPFVQVSRLGQPLINEAVIGLDDKDRWNALAPKDDVPVFGGYFLNPVIVRDAVAVGIYDQATVNAGLGGAGFDNNRTDILQVISLNAASGLPGAAQTIANFGDVLRVDPSRDSAYPNGRALEGAADVLGDVRAADQEAGDVTDIELSLLLFALTGPGAVNVSDGVQHNDKNFLTTFPFLALPFRGSDQGHGKPTAP